MKGNSSSTVVPNTEVQHLFESSHLLKFSEKLLFAFKCPKIMVYHIMNHVLFSSVF